MNFLIVCRETLFNFLMEVEDEDELVLTGGR